MNRLQIGISVIALACAGGALAAVAETPPAPPMGAEAMGPQGMGMGRVVTRDQAKMGAEALFAHMDLTRDGKIDAADHAAHIGKQFDKLDTNHDGMISRDEFLSAHPLPGAGMKGMDKPGMGEHGMGGPGMGEHGMGGPGRGEGAMMLGMAILHEADPQHTGVVTHEAFINAALAMFDKMDTNHDGKVTPEERRAAHQMMMGGHGGPGMGGPGMGGPGMGRMGDDDMPGMPH